MPDPKSIAPWDVQKYFFTPTERIINVAVLGQQLAQADPNRIAIIFSTSSSNGIAVSTNPNQVAGQGMIINASYPVHSITQQEFGPLVNQAFFGDPLVAPANITVIEIVVSKWPEV